MLKGKKLYLLSLALPALSALIPADWEKEFCYEYFDDVNFDTDASVIGISSMGYEIFRGVEIAKEFRRRGKIVLFGGFQPHISKDYVAPYCDSVVHGNPGLSDMAAILKDAEGYSLKKEYFCKTDLRYRFDYSIVDPKRVYFMPVLLGVGCRNSCDYCCIASIYDGTYSLRNFRHVMDELEYLYRTTRNIAFVDTNMYNNRDYLRKICREMISREYAFIWGGQSTVDIGEDVETLQLLKSAGCRVLFIGLESIDQSNLDTVHKKYSAESYVQKIKNIHDAGIKIAAFFMYGLDSDTRDTSRFLSQFIIKNRIALPLLNILVPTPGTKMYDRLEREGRIIMNDEMDFLKNNVTYNSSFNLCFYIPRNMTPAEVENGFIDLLRSLSGYAQIIRRSVNRDLRLSLFLLQNNLSFRKEYFLLKKKQKERLKTNVSGL